MTKTIDEALKALREPFPEHQISQKPKETKQQKDEREKDRRLGIRCQKCGQWHHKDTVHLDYVGHAALTDRLLAVDPLWNWEPVSFAADGQPAFDRIGGMWIRLTVCGHTRLGYGSADGKQGGDAVKEVIGDALRNAAMRFGAALDLWHKGELHLPEPDGAKDEPEAAPAATSKAKASERQQRQDEPKPISAAAQKRQLLEIDKDLVDCHSDADVKRCAAIWQSIAARDGWSRDYRLAAKEKFDAKRIEIANAPAYVDDDGFPGSSDITNHPMMAG